MAAAASASKTTRIEVKPPLTTAAPFKRSNSSASM
jgi:hypothetical protein